MGLDIKLPIGIMFSLFGIILTVYGFITYNDAFMYTKSLGINVNLWIGIVMLVFGGIMLFFSNIKKK
ncbi:MAG TPA: hypothetical protein DCQ31_13525 [Bacteroidales bacterium]|nr:hypothetical protein [Bacteroidales bacterium]